MPPVLTHLTVLLLIVVGLPPEPKIGVAEAPRPLIEQGPTTQPMLTALLSYEASIRSLCWHQRSYLPPCGARNRADWFLLEDLDRYVDEHGSWLSDGEECWGDGPPEYTVRRKRVVRVGGGPWRLTFDSEHGEGVLSQDDGFFICGTNLWRVMGHGLDYAHPTLPRSLGELAKQSAGLEFLPPTVDEPWPGIRFLAELPNITLKVEARLDPDHGFAVRLVRSVDARSGNLLECFVVISYHEADTTWIPAIAVCFTYEPLASPSVLTEEKIKDLAAARKLRGLPPELQTDEIRRWVARLMDQRRVCPMGARDAEGELVSPQVLIVDAQEVNHARSLPELASRVPADSRIYDGTSGVWISGARAGDALASLVRGVLPPQLGPAGGEP